MNARTLAVFRLYQLFNGILFSGPIWAVFLLSRGLSLTQFGIVEAVLHVGMLIAQVPTGALADALGRRRLLIAAGFFTAAAELGYVYAPGFALICLAGGIHGVAFALRTGADEAYLFDSLAHDDAQAQFPRMLGGLWAVFQFAGAISFMIGGLIATYSPPLAFWLTASCALAASAIATRLPDDARGEARHGVRTRRARPAGAAALAPAGDADAGMERVLGGRDELVVLRRAAVPGPRRLGRAARRRARRRRCWPGRASRGWEAGSASGCR